MYKDAPHEGYTHRKFSRAILLALLIGVVIHVSIPFNMFRADHAVILFGAVYAVERGLEELYKTFLRVEDQSKYFIPMQFHILGRVVQSRAIRWSVAASWVVVVALIGVLIAQSDSRSGLASHRAGIILLGGLGGWLSAVGGAAKDAPIEGFEFFKFLRSPVIAMAWAAIIAHLTPLILVIPLVAVGYTVATIETYKTFFFPGRPRGKFAGKPTPFPEWLVRRNRFVPLFIGIWVVVIAGVVAALVGPHQGRL
jgi:hypothetical protein